MAEDLGKLVPCFGGIVAFVHCFGHILNLIAQRILRPFKVENATGENAGDDDLDAAMQELAAGLGVDDLEGLADDTEEDGEFNEQEVDAWVDEAEELSEEDKAEL